MAKLLASFTLALSLASFSLAQSVPTVKDNTVTGTGFVITAPVNLLIETAATAETLHGFYIDLPPQAVDKETSLRRTAARSSSYRYIAFDTLWDVGDMPSLNAVVESITSNILDHVPADLVAPGPVMLDANLPVRLGTLPARRLVIKYRNTAKQPAVRQVIVAYNARKDAAAVVYLLTLNTTQQDFQEDVNVFSKILSGFKLTSQ
ncbi:MAG: hypothetical protein ACXWCW_31880 [Burkholderiales bacterium]